MKAVSYYLVIDKIKEEPKSTSGFVLTENQNEDVRYLKGTVISVGESIDTLKEGDTVWYDKHAGHGIQYKDKLYFVIKVSDIVLVD